MGHREAPGRCLAQVWERLRAKAPAVPGPAAYDFTEWELLAAAARQMEPPVPRSSVYRVEGVYRLILHQGGCPGVLRGQKAGDGVLLEAEAIERGEVLRRWDAVEWLRSQPRREAMAQAESAAPKT